MLKTRIILIVVSAAVIGLLFLLPKVVVENENQLAATADSTTVAPATPAAVHNSVPETLSKAIKSLRSQYLSSPENKKSSIFADSLQNLYTKAGQFDSAAWFADKAASFLNTTESFLKAGNSYYEAYTFAMKPEKQQALAEKTREYLEKVIKADPKNLEAKTKIGMTYFSSNPPKGVGILREVLEADPKNELVLFNLGMLAIQSGQYDRAIERLNELVAVNPKHTQGQMLLGVAYMNKGEKDKARQQFEKVKQLDNDPSVQATVDSYLNDLK
ncbi:MAG: peptidase [Cytophaga sp.]|nr:peptidase [Cytophaga sp.]